MTDAAELLHDARQARRSRRDRATLAAGFLAAERLPVDAAAIADVAGDELGAEADTVTNEYARDPFQVRARALRLSSRGDRIRADG